MSQAEVAINIYINCTLFIDFASWAGELIQTCAFPKE